MGSETRAVAPTCDFQYEEVDATWRERVHDMPLDGSLHRMADPCEKASCGHLRNRQHPSQRQNVIPGDARYKVFAARNESALLLDNNIPALLAAPSSPGAQWYWSARP